MTEQTDEMNFLNETDSVLDLDSPEPAQPKKPGKKKNEVWNFFIEQETRQSGHSSCTCVYCGNTWDRGRIPDMIAHLALQCDEVEAEVKEKYLRILAENKPNEQSSITKK
jgi:hypothetical protein